MILHLDYETRSPVDLKTAGVYPYALHPETDAWCAAYTFDDEEEIGLWKLGEPVPERIADTLRDVEIHAWNAAFERVIWWLLCCKRYGWPRPEREQFYCVAAAAAAMALPRKLEQAAVVLGLPERKDEEGSRVMKQLMRPRKPTKKNPERWWSDQAKLDRLYSYCQQDVRTERAIEGKLRRLSDYELGVYHLDQKINDRGVSIDVDLVCAAQRIVVVGTQRANDEISRITQGAVDTVTKVADLTRWFQEAGTELEDVRKETLRDLLEQDDLDATVRRVAELRSEAAKSSTSKLKSMLRCICADERARGLLLYHGAGTGRWSGRLIQPQNFPRGEYFVNGRPVKVKNPERFIDAVLAGDYDAIAAEYPPLVVISALLRSMLRAAPGHVFMAGDFSQIEARVLAWIAEQNDLVEMFATGGKIYEEMAALIYDRPPSSIGKESVERQVGKNSVLGAGFQMGAPRFQGQVKTQTGIDLDDATAQRAIGAYRARWTRIVAFWNEINGAAIRAVARLGSTQSCGRGGAIRFVVRGQFLWCILPSGRPLAYGLPRLRDEKLCSECYRVAVVQDGVVAPHLFKDAPCSGAGKFPTERTAVTYMGVNGYSRKWQRFGAYGGLFTENVVQAMARDLIAGAMVRQEKHGYRPVLSIHDEVLGEPEAGHGSLEHFLDLMRARPRWADGLPVAVEGWQGERYRK